MNPAPLHSLWLEFLAAWPAERVRQMALEEYTNSNKDDAFIYWIEKRLEELGSIWGGSAFKFGIYCRDNTDAKEASKGKIWGDQYAWLSRFGDTPEAAFETIRANIVEVVEAASSGEFARVEEVDLANTLKWKVAFLYQDREHPGILPIFKKEGLFFNYRTTIDPTAKLKSTPYHVMYETLIERHSELGDVFEIGTALWNLYQDDKNRTPDAWAIPLGTALQDAKAVEEFTSKTTVDSEDIDPFLDNLLTGADMSEGDELALLLEGDVRALGQLTSAEPGHFSWEQTPVNFPAGLAVLPGYEPRKLTAAEREAIWEQAPEDEESVEEDTSVVGWKVSAETDGRLWGGWRDGNYVSVGWDKLGDLTDVSRDEFRKRRDKLAKKDPKGHSVTRLNQVWRFRNIAKGARIVANQGTTRVFGVGTVTGPYFHVAGDEYPHRLPVHWDDVRERRVSFPHWARTLLPIKRQADLDTILADDSLASEVPKGDGQKAKSGPEAPPCNPQNVILFGPPGTGKTYSTTRRALELILGPEKLEGLTEKGLTSLFREHQMRGQIEFVTFHQAYGYEEFVEGLRPVLDNVDGSEVRYEIHDGVFKRIALRAAAEGLRDASEAPGFDELWARLVADLQDEGERVAQSQSGKNYVLRVSSQGNIATYQCEVDSEGNVETVTEKRQLASKRNSRILWDNRQAFGGQQDNLTYQKTLDIFGVGNHYTALWIVYGELVSLSRNAAAGKTVVDKALRVQQALDKPLAGGASFGFSAANRQFVLIIDEINRGNISKILGELITLLEPDKRLGTRGELKLPLSYSPSHRFAVPPNLHVLGTMNTADRSIALMDVALRRRFTFEELMPESGVIRDVLGKVTPSKPLIDLTVELFETLNARIRFLYDRDHQLGHSYFLNVRNLEDLRGVFVDRVIPLLQEYFYGAWDKICTVLGCPYDEAGQPRRTGHVVESNGDSREYVAPMVLASRFPEVATLGFDHEDYEDRVDFRIRPSFQEGTLSEDKLLSAFLCVLMLDREEYNERLVAHGSTGTGEPIPAETAGEAVTPQDEAN